MTSANELHVIFGSGPVGYEPYLVDHSRYAQLFGDHATPLREAIRATVQWYRAA